MDLHTHTHTHCAKTRMLIYVTPGTEDERDEEEDDTGPLHPRLLPGHVAFMLLQIIYWKERTEQESARPAFILWRQTKHCDQYPFKYSPSSKLKLAPAAKLLIF